MTVLKNNPIKKLIKAYENLSKFRKILIAFLILFIMFCFAPYLRGVTCVGSIPPALISAFCIFCAFNWDKIKNPKTKRGKRAVYIVGTAVVLGSGFIIFLFAIMFNAAYNTVPAEVTDSTVIVLGCKINGNRPSRMLAARLKKAAEYLNENPGATCVVAGGQGSDEDYPEALVMKNYLMEKGVDGERVFMEDKSTSTDENIKFSAEIIEGEELSENVLIVSDRFHQYRAQRLAKKYGLTGYSLACKTYWYLALPYWFREMGGIVVMTLSGEL